MNLGTLDVGMERWYGAITLIGALCTLVVAYIGGHLMAQSRREWVQVAASPFALVLAIVAVLLGFHGVDHLYHANLAQYIRTHPWPK